MPKNCVAGLESVPVKKSSCWRRHQKSSMRYRSARLRPPRARRSLGRYLRDVSYYFAGYRSVPS